MPNKNIPDDSESLDKGTYLADSDDTTSTEESESPVDSLYEMFNELTPEEQTQFLDMCREEHPELHDKVEKPGGVKVPYKGPKNFKMLEKM